MSQGIFNYQQLLPTSSVTVVCVFYCDAQEMHFGVPNKQCSIIALLLLLLVYDSFQHGYRKLGDCNNQPISQISDLDNDFETGSPCPWIEESTQSVHWKVENYDASWEPDCPAPQPEQGSNYMRVDRGPSLSFGVAILRSPIFTLPPGDVISLSFSFWIRSKWPQFTNLEVRHINY